MAVVGMLEGKPAFRVHFWTYCPWIYLNYLGSADTVCLHCPFWQHLAEIHYQPCYVCFPNSGWSYASASAVPCPAVTSHCTCEPMWAWRHWVPGVYDFSRWSVDGASLSVRWGNSCGIIDGMASLLLGVWFSLWDLISEFSSVPFTL